jgi:histidinol phosphatase-like PHP family hydrolase
MFYDLHLHTDMSDGSLTPSGIVKMAQERYAKAGVADHLSRYQQIHDEKSFAHYVETLDKYDVLKSGEICLGSELDISDASLDQLDYIIGSVHAIRFDRALTLFFFDEAVRFPDHAYFIQLYTDRLVRFLSTERMDILGHPTLLPVFLQCKNPDLLFTDEQYAAIVRAGVENDVAFEISSRWRMPTVRFLAECKKQGALFTFGSDAHTTEDALEFDYGIRMMQAAGLDYDSLYTPEKKL